jgi:hypothetical protein
MNKEQGNGISYFALLMNEVHINFTKPSTSTFVLNCGCSLSLASCFFQSKSFFQYFVNLFTSGLSKISNILLFWGGIIQNADGEAPYSQPASSISSGRLVSSSFWCSRNIALSLTLIWNGRISAIGIDIFGEHIFSKGLIYTTSKCSQPKNMNLRRISDPCAASPCLGAATRILVAFRCIVGSM